MKCTDHPFSLDERCSGTSGEDAITNCPTKRYTEDRLPV